MTLISGPQECAPDLSDPRSVATYAAEEISEAKDGFVRHFSDEEGMWKHTQPEQKDNILTYMWCNNDSNNLLWNPQGTSTSAMLTPWSSVDELSIQLMISFTELQAPSGTQCVLL